VVGYRSAAGVSVTAIIISPRIVPDHPGNLPGWSWALSRVSETAAYIVPLNVTIVTLNVAIVSVNVKCRITTVKYNAIQMHA
jgi:hypothetical protein